MFIFSIARRYLIPRRKTLSLSLIALMSVWVIATVVWLLLLFLSVTEGIEKNWISRLTSLNAPVKIVPTSAYYESYYYQVDSIASESDYTYKSIREKLLTANSDPHNESIDEEIPFYWPTKETNSDGESIDLVKEAFTSLSSLKKDKYTDLNFQDFETTGALMRLRQLSASNDPFDMERVQQSFLTQASYFSSFPEFSDDLHNLLEAPSAKDIEHLLYLASLQEKDIRSDTPNLPMQTSATLLNPKRKAILSNITVQTVSTVAPRWHVPHDAIKESFTAVGKMQHGEMSFLVILTDPKSANYADQLLKGTIERRGDALFFKTTEFTTPLSKQCAIYSDTQIQLSTNLNHDSIIEANYLHEITLDAQFTLQGKELHCKVPFTNLNLESIDAVTHFDTPPENKPLWPYHVKNKCYMPEGGIILPNNYRSHHISLGDSGYLAYGANTSTMVQEMRSPVWVCGFYDPGVMTVGARAILAEHSLIRDINMATQNLALDPSLATGIQVWTSDLQKVPELVRDLQEQFAASGISEYWNVIPFYEYDFAKDLMDQFQSDRYLFMIVGIIILIVACSNVITLLLLLVNDKKHEIGIFLSMGAKKRSIAAIFALCGSAMGIISAVIGCVAALFTLKHIDSLVSLLNALEGQEAFNAAFYGNCLPNELSSSALFFILCLTPILAAIAGLVPAIKACRLKPNAILRSE